MLEIVTIASTLLLIMVLLYVQHKIIKELKNIRIPPPQKIEFPKMESPKIEFPKIEIPSAKEVVLDLNPVVEAVKNINIPAPQKIEFPKMEFPKIEIPPAKEVVLDLNPVVEAVKNINIPAPQKIEFPKIEFPQMSITAELLQSVVNTQNDLIKSLQETATLIRVNEAEFQSGLETFHKAIDKLLAQIPNEEKELNSQKEFMQKFEEAFVKVQETAAEAMNENSLRLQEILTEFLNREAK
ncbi:MAG: hypothetical protein LBC64_11475 [Fibromonadaceae bacterium]|jgi:hypothetical protein|nr:hypothetical protein [Fibromonadaceae bacterium]